MFNKPGLENVDPLYIYLFILFFTRAKSGYTHSHRLTRTVMISHHMIYVNLCNVIDGFSEGKCLGEEVFLQEGFNVGYEEGFQYSFPVAVIRGVIGALKTHLKKSDSPYWQQIQEITNELLEFERHFIQIKKLAVASGDKMNEVKSSKEPEESLQNSFENTTGTSAHSDRKSFVASNEYREDIKTVLAQFHSLKEKSVSLLEECGFSKLSHLIAEIFITK